MTSDFTTLTTEQLEKMDKRALIAIVTSLQGQLNSISGRLNFLTEQIALMNQRSFGHKTERADQLEQDALLTIYDYFNEPEAMSESSLEAKTNTGWKYLEQLANSIFSQLNNFSSEAARKNHSGVQV